MTEDRICGASPLEIYEREQNSIACRTDYVATLSDFSYELEVLTPRDGTHLIRGHDLVCTGSITNTSGVDWNIVVDSVSCLKLAAEIHSVVTGTKTATTRCFLEGETIPAGETRAFSFQISTARCDPAEYRLTLDLVYEMVCWFSRKSGLDAKSLDFTVAPFAVFESQLPESPESDDTETETFKTYVAGNRPFSIYLNTRSQDLVTQSIRDNREDIFREPFFCAEFVDDQTALLDIGANIGIFSLLFASRGAKVYAIEADPKNAKLLKNSAALNAYENLHLYNVAVSDQPGSIQLVSDGPNSFAFHDAQSQHAEFVTMQVEAIAIDQWKVADDIPEKVLVKIDIEGSEVHCLRGMKDFLSTRNLPPLFIESNAYYLHLLGMTPADLFREIECLGYVMYRFEPDSALRSWNANEPQFINVHNFVCVNPETPLKESYRILGLRDVGLCTEEIERQAKAKRPFERATLARALASFPLMLDIPNVAAVIENLSRDEEPSVRHAMGWRQ